MILTYVETLFPTAFRGLTNKQRQMTLQTWNQEFAQYSFFDVQNAVRAAIREKKPNGFPPGFDEIIAQLPISGQLTLPGIDEYEAKVVEWLEQQRRSPDGDFME